MTSANFTRSERRRLAEQVGLNEQYLYQCLSGRRDMSAVEARRIETVSAGVLTRQMVCQKTWALIWPELVHTPPKPKSSGHPGVQHELHL